LIADIKAWLISLGAGASRAFGEPSADLQLVEHPKGHADLALVREGYAVQTFPGPEKLARRHTFDDLPSFAEWLKKHAKPASTEILFGRDGTVVAALNPSLVTGDIVSCRLQFHPRQARWANLLPTAIGQRDLHRHIVGALEDFPEARTQTGEDLGSSGQHLAAQLLRIEVIKGGNLTTQLDELGVTRISGKHEETQVTAKLPPRFSVRFPWFLGARPLAEYSLELLLSVNASDKGVTFKLDAPAYKVVELQALVDAVVYLRELLGEEWLVGLGRLQTEAVPLLSHELA
jgi:hypothetical protein